VGAAPRTIGRDDQIHLHAFTRVAREDRPDRALIVRVRRDDDERFFGGSHRNDLRRKEKESRQRRTTCAIHIHLRGSSSCTYQNRLQASSATAPGEKIGATSQMSNHLLSMAIAL
jgi:hypothetical protein